MNDDFLEELLNNKIIKFSSNRMHKIYYDMNTGTEVFRELNVRPDDKLSRKESIEWAKRKREWELAVELTKKRGFVQMKRAMRDVTGRARQYHSHLFMKLIPIVSFDEKPLSLNGKSLNQTKIAKYLGVQRKVASTFIRNMIELGILEECKGGTKNEIFYKLCSKYIIKGEFEEPEEYSVKVLQKQLKHYIDLIEEETERYKKKERKIKRDLYPLSLLLALLPYVHYQSHIICENSKEDFLKEHTTISEAIRHNKRLVKRLTDKKIWNEMSGQNVKQLSVRDKQKFNIYFEILLKTNVIALFQGSNKMYIVNPNIVFVMSYFKDETWTETLKSLFTIVESF
ncbi:hypothetical protein [Bacillus sp. EB01]|uniref:hypothetical protein n=1 Tax=Bacillus sp. EB01 TaxID=1347086 RepID=UPI0005C6604F|nr:hypothetical protein [Bacillus sp. EB01]